MLSVKGLRFLTNRNAPAFTLTGLHVVLATLMMMMMIMMMMMMMMMMIFFFFFFFFFLQGPWCKIHLWQVY